MPGAASVACGGRRGALQSQRVGWVERSETHHERTDMRVRPWGGSDDGFRYATKTPRLICFFVPLSPPA
jgi:hypothetical protein